MKPNNYFPKKYLQDHAKFGQDVLCGATIHERIKDIKPDEFFSLKDYFICAYELNLLGQVIYTHFNSDYEKWIEVTVPYTDCRCYHNGGHPITILENVLRETKKLDQSIDFSKETILEYDKFFLRYLEEICKQNSFQELEPGVLIKTMKQDPDCVGPFVQRFFSKMK